MKKHNKKLNFAQKAVIGGIGYIEPYINDILVETGVVWTIKHPILSGAMLVAEFPIVTAINVVGGLFAAPMNWYNAAKEIDEDDYEWYFDELSEEKS